MEKNQVETNTIDSWHDPSKKLASYKALLIGVFTKNSAKREAEEHLQELKLLSTTHGIEVIASLPVMVRSFSASLFIGSGKVDEIRSYVHEIGANLVIFDDEISPVQQRNLEKEIKVPVIDRTEIILGVFSDRAQSHEAKLQIELARLRYTAPRLKRMWTHLSRQSGGGGGSSGGGYLKGEGEKQIEIDRRIIQHRVERLQSELSAIKQYRTTQRSLRERNGIPVFAIVGYTNAGKSTLMNHLTNANVLVEDKLFATLDTTTRNYLLPNNQEILVSDTVGFIRKLPHLLVAAFKSTLEETVEADFLLHVIDASHPQALDQAKTTLEVLSELKADSNPILTIINKIDLLQEEPEKKLEVIEKLKISYPKAIAISAVTGEGIDQLLKEMMQMVQSRRKRVALSIPQSQYQHIATTMRVGKVYDQKYEENNVILDVELPIIVTKQLSDFIIEER